VLIIPIDQRFRLPDKTRHPRKGKKKKKRGQKRPYRVRENKNNLAAAMLKDLIEEAKDRGLSLQGIPVIFDGAYCQGKKLGEEAAKAGMMWVGKGRKDWEITLTTGILKGQTFSLGDLARIATRDHLWRNSSFCGPKERYARFVGSVKGFGEVVVVIWERPKRNRKKRHRRRGNPTFGPIRKILMTNRKDAKGPSVIRNWNLRWWIEVMFRDLKQWCGLNAFQYQRFAAIDHHVSLAYLGYMLVSYMRFKWKKEHGCKTIGEMVRALRSHYPSSHEFLKRLETPDSSTSAEKSNPEPMQIPRRKVG